MNTTTQERKFVMWKLKSSRLSSMEACEVDHASQSTVVNLGKKQKGCFVWCIWIPVQKNTSGPDNFRILGGLLTIHHRCTCIWDWTEMPTVSFLMRAKTLNSARYPKSACNRCVIEHFGGICVFMLWLLCILTICWYISFWYWTELDIFPFLLKSKV